MWVFYIRYGLWVLSYKYGLSVKGTDIQAYMLERDKYVRALSIAVMTL